MFPRLCGAAAALTLVATLTACGSTGSGTGIASAAADGATRTSKVPAADKTPDLAKARLYAACMRKHGVDMPDPTSGDHLTVGGGPSSGPVDLRKINAATRACKAFVPNGGELAKPPAEAVAAMRKMAKCMRDNGITKFPDPSANGQMVIEKSSGIDLSSPKFRAAQAKCAKYLPDGGQHIGRAPGSK